MLRLDKLVTFTVFQYKARYCAEGSANMSDKARANAELAKERLVLRLEAVEAEAADLREQLARVNEVLATFLRYETLDPAKPIPAVGPGTGQSANGRKNSKRQAVVDAAIAAIEKAGRPLKRRELFEEVKRAGLVVNGKDPLVVFSTMLWREQDRIVRLDGYGYWPIDKPFAPSGYSPSPA